jgi:chromosome segregation ATPase
MNIFRQVFASANPNYEVPRDEKPKAKVFEKAAKLVPTDPPPKSPPQKRLSLARAKPKRVNREAIEMQSAIVEMEAKLQQMNAQLKQSEGSLAKIREHNMMLSKRNEDLENLIDRLRKASIQTGLAFREVQSKLDEEAKERNEQWRFRITELQFEIEAARSDR